MAWFSLGLKGLAAFAGGSVDKAVQSHIARAIHDCEDRPGEKKPREITLKVRVVPVILQDGAVTDCKVECEVSSSVPKHVSRTVDCHIKAGGVAKFNDLAMDDADQRTIDEFSNAVA